jgi:hypothetical protein
MADSIPLADAIHELRSNISTAMKRAEGEDLKFALGPIELELTMVATTEGSADGKLSFKIFGIGADAKLGGKLSDSLTHRMKLVLTPKGDKEVSAEKE